MKPFHRTSVHVIVFASPADRFSPLWKYQPLVLITPMAGDDRLLQVLAGNIGSAAVGFLLAALFFGDIAGKPGKAGDVIYFYRAYEYLPIRPHGSHGFTVGF